MGAGTDWAAEVYGRNFEAVYRLCYAYMKNAPDAEDAVSETFFRLMRAKPRLESPEHERAWLFRTASNLCKSALGHWWRRREALEAHPELCAEPPRADETLGAVLALPERYRAVVYLHYYEGYSGREIAKLLSRPHSTVRNHLCEARALLKEVLGGENEN